MLRLPSPRRARRRPSARWRASPCVALSLAACTAGSRRGLVEHRLRPRGAGGGEPVRWRNAPRAATWPAEPRWTPATCAAARPGLRAGPGRRTRQSRAAPAGVRAAARQRRVDRALQAARDLSQRGAGGRRSRPAAGARRGPARSRRRGPAAAGGAGSGQIAGPVQPILVAWARFAAGARAQAIDELAGADPSAGTRTASRLSSRRHAGPRRSAARRLEASACGLSRSGPAPVRVVGARAVELQLAAGDRAPPTTVAAARKAEPDDRQVERLAAGRGRRPRAGRGPRARPPGWAMPC